MKCISKPQVNMEQAASSVALSAQQALQQLQDAVLEAVNKNPDSTEVVHKKLSELSIHMQALLQRHAALEQSLQDRDVAEKALRQVISKTEAHTARLQAEISRLRRQTQHITADDQQSFRPAASDQSACVPAAREALMATAIAAKDKPEATITKLESEVTACHDRILALETELAEAASSNSSRLAEQQKAFLAKLEQLRQVHGQQLATAVQASQVQQQEHQGACRQLKQQLEQAKHIEQEQQDQIASLQKQILHLQQQVQSRQHIAELTKPAACGKDGTTNINTEAKMITENTALDAEGGSLGHLTGAHQAAANSDDVQAEATALQLMEQQLARLSGIIRSHQTEIKQLQQTVLDGFTERQQLQKLLQELQQQKHAPQQQSPHTHGALRAVKGPTAVPAGPGSGRKLSSRQLSKG